MVRHGRRRGADRGVSMVEFAILAPVAFLLLLGALDFGRAGYDNNVVASAAREGARAVVPASQSGASVASLQATVVAAAKRTLGGGITPPTTTTVTSALGSCPSPASGRMTLCLVTPTGGSPSGRVSITVQVKYSFEPWVPLVKQFFNNGAGYVLTSSTTMTTEY